MFFTTDKISTQQHKNGSQRSTVKTTNKELQLELPESLQFLSMTKVQCRQLSMKFASFTQTFRYKNTSPNILINWRLHVTNYFTTICQDMSFLAGTCIISVMERSREKQKNLFKTLIHRDQTISSQFRFYQFKETKERTESLNLKVNACKSKLKNPRHVCKVGDKIVFKILIFSRMMRNLRYRLELSASYFWTNKATDKNFIISITKEKDNLFY